MRKIAIVVLFVILLFLMCGCVKAKTTDLFGATKTSDTKAYIHVNGHTVIVDVDQYLIGSNGIVMVYGIDGTTYKTHMVNVVLFKNATQQQ